jgi:hypothetical protein
MPLPSSDTPGVRRPAGLSRLGLAVASLAGAGSFAVALATLGGPPAPAALATPVPADAPGSQAPDKTIYVRLPAPTAAPAPTATPSVTAPKFRTPVVTRQSGFRGTAGNEHGEQEGND